MTEREQSRKEKGLPNTNRTVPKKRNAFRSYLNRYRRTIKEVIATIVYGVLFMAAIGLTGAADHDAITMTQWIISIIAIGVIGYCTYLILFAVPDIGRKTPKKR